MYGMVNRAFEDYFLQYHGEAVWLRTKAAAGILDETFLSMEQYPDSVTLAIVEAGAQELGITGAELLERIGVYWITFASHAGYRELLRSAGTTIPVFLANLDELHTRIHLTFPEIRPPSWRVRDEDETGLVVEYRSTRDGLAPFAIGLLRGVGAMFDQEFTLTHVIRRADGADHDAFDLRYVQPA